jgi:hypothetical protein
MFLYQAKKINHEFFDATGQFETSGCETIDPSDITNIVQQTLVLIGNVHNILMTDHCQTLLSKLLPKSMDLMDDSSWQKGLLKSDSYLL